ncbi:MAG: hypothetical protein OXS33_02435 [bacterium]|nr:hypothetical protein [bacterium]
MTKASQRSALREAGFTKPQTNALAMALEPLATKEDLLALKEDLKGDLAVLRGDVTEIRIDIRWMKWVGGAIGLTVLAELVSGLFS